MSSVPKDLPPRRLSNEALLRNTQSLVAEERKLTTAILWHMHEIQVRRLYAEKGYASLFEYAVQVLGYSEAAAGRRIAAMRLLVDVPEIEPALQKGEVSLSTLSTIQSFIQRKEEPVSKFEKKELVLALRGKSRRECEKHLVSLDPVAATPKERERVVSPTQIEIRFVADDELMQKLQKIKELDGHVHSNPSYLERFHRMADLALKELDPLSQKKNTQRKSQKTSIPMSDDSTDIKPNAAPTNTASKTTSIEAKSNFTPPAELESSRNPRYIPSELRRLVWRRDQGHCQFKSSDGKKCGSRFALEFDHIEPLAWSGKTELKNLQLLCRTHNRFKALNQLGPAVMQSYIKMPYLQT